MGQRQSIQTEDPILATVNSINSEVEAEDHKLKMQQQKVQMDQKLQALENTMFDFAERYGEENDLTQLMIQLHGVALMMKDQAHIMEGFNTAYEFMFETLNFYDEIFKMQTELMQGSMQTSYGPIARMKEAIRVRRTVRNVQNRMKVMVGRIATMGKISSTFVTSLSAATAKMRVTLQKTKAKSDKKNAKTGGQAVDVTSASAQLVREHLARKAAGGAGNDTSAPTAPSSPSPAPSPKPSGSGTGGLDDIL